MNPSLARHHRSIELLAQAGSADAAAVAIKVEPSPPHLSGPSGTLTEANGATLQLNARAVDAINNVVAGVAGAWASDNTAVATVNSSGLVTAVGDGTCNITFTQTAAPHLVGSFALTVVADAVPASVTIAPLTAAISAGTQAFTATVKNAEGRTLTPVAGTWSSSNVAAATVAGTNDTNGVATKVAAGVTDINFTTTEGGIIGAAAAVLTVS